MVILPLLHILENLVSASSETLRLIELTAARLRQDHHADMATIRSRTDRRGKCHSDFISAAWGSDVAPSSLDDLMKLLPGLPDGVDVDLSGLPPGCTFPPQIGRIVLNVLLLAARSMPSGGDVLLAGSVDDLFLRMEGADAAWPAGMGACISDEKAAQAAITAGGSTLMALTALLAHASRVRLSFLLSPGAASGPPILRLGGG
jgi:hypothetical protein